MPKITAPTVGEYRARTPETLVEAFESLVVENGYDAVSLREVADRAGVGRTALYNYVPDKVSLLLGAGQRSTPDLRRAVADITRRHDVDASTRLVLWSPRCLSDARGRVEFVLPTSGEALQLLAAFAR